jgi:hypothetical protein
VGLVLGKVGQETGIAFEQVSESRSPAGQIAGAAESPLVRWSAAIARHLGRGAKLSNAGSANLNVAIAGGTLAIGLGGERGGRRGFPDEWADAAVLKRMTQHIGLLALAVGGGTSVK